MIKELITSAEILRPVVQSWYDESNAETMHFGDSIEVLMRYLQYLVDCDSATILVLLRDDKPVGFIGGVLFHSHLDGKLCVNEKNWYVMKKFRGVGSIRLKQQLEKWARDNGAERLMMTASKLAGDSYDTVCKMYERDMELYETTYIKELT